MTNSGSQRLLDQIKSFEEEKLYEVPAKKINNEDASPKCTEHQAEIEEIQRSIRNAQVKENIEINQNIHAILH